MIHGSGRSPGEGNGNPLQYSCLENPMDRGAWKTCFYSLQIFLFLFFHFFFLFLLILDLSYLKVKMLVTQLCPTLCDPTDCSPPGSSVHGDSPGKNTGVGGCQALCQGIFPTQGPNPGLLHCRQMLYHLSHQGFCIRGRKIWAPPKKRVKILDRTGI